MNLPVKIRTDDSAYDAKSSLSKQLHQLFSADPSFLDRNPERQVVRLEVPAPGVSPLHWLECQEDATKIYWSDRQADFESAGVGLADKVRCDRENYSFKLAEIKKKLGSHSGKSRYYGGMRFNARVALVDEHWLPYGYCLFVLPRFELFSDSSGAYLACNVVIGPRSGFRYQLDGILESLDRLTITRTDVAYDDNRKEFVRQDIPAKAQWSHSVESVLAILKSGNAEKIVLGRGTFFSFRKPLRPLLILRQLREIEPIAYHFCVQLREGNAFIGASPERLYKRCGKYIESEAVAGTCSRGSTPDDDRRLGEALLRSDKNYREHICVRDNLRAVLQKQCRSLRASDEVTLLKQAKVQHLYSYIQGHLIKEMGDAELINLLHPTPAVGGLPRDKALAYIDKIEPFDRGWYAGPVGWIARDMAEFAVAIRCALVTDGNLRLFAGAGVVEGSLPELEWEEMETKIRAFLTALRIG